MSEIEKKRTLQQNKAAHLLFTKVADSLNDSGMTMMRVLREDAEIPWTPDSVKAYLYRPFIRAMYDKNSTTQLTTKEIGDAIDVMCDHLAKVTGIPFEMPSVESLINQKR